MIYGKDSCRFNAGRGFSGKPQSNRDLESFRSSQVVDEDGLEPQLPGEASTTQ